MSYIAKPKIVHPDVPRNSLGLSHIDYEGVISNDKIREWSFSSDVLETGLLPDDTLTVSVSGAYNGTTFKLLEPFTT